MERNDRRAHQTGIGPLGFVRTLFSFIFFFYRQKSSDLYTQLWQRGFVLRGSFRKIAFYTVPLSAVDVEILLLPVRARHVENARTWFPTL